MEKLEPGQILDDATTLIDHRNGWMISFKDWNSVQQFVVRNGQGGNGFYFAEIWSAAEYFHQVSSPSLV